MEKLATLSDLAAYKALSEKQNAVQLKLITDKIDELAYRLVSGKVEFCKTHSYLLEDEEYNPATLEPRAYNTDAATYIELDPGTITLTFYPGSTSGSATYWPLPNSSSAATIADYPITDTGSVKMSANQLGFKGSDTLAVTPIDYIEPEVGTLHLTLNSVPTIADLKGLVKHYTINDRDFPVSEKDWQSKITIVGTEGGNETAAAAWWKAYQDAIAENSDHPTVLYSSTTDLAPLTSDPFKLKCTYVTDGKREVTVLVPLEFVEDKEDLASESIAQITIVGKNLEDKDVTFDSANATSNLLKFADDKSTTIPLTLSTIKLTYNQLENDTTGEIELTKVDDDNYSFAYDNVNYDLAVSHTDFAKVASIRGTTNASIAFTISLNGKRLTSFFQTVELQKANVINVVNKQFLFYLFMGDDETTAISSAAYSQIENYFITAAAQNGHTYLLSNEALANDNAYCIDATVISGDGDISIDKENNLISQIEVQINDTEVSLQDDIKVAVSDGTTVLQVNNIDCSTSKAVVGRTFAYNDATAEQDIATKDYNAESIDVSETYTDAASNAVFEKTTTSVGISSFKTAVIQQMAVVSNRILNAALFSCNGTDGISTADLTAYDVDSDKLSYDLYEVTDDKSQSLLTLNRNNVHNITIAIPDADDTTESSDDSSIDATAVNGVVVDAYSLLKSDASSYTFYLNDNGDLYKVTLSKDDADTTLQLTAAKQQLTITDDTDDVTTSLTGSITRIVHKITATSSDQKLDSAEIAYNPTGYKIDNDTALASFIQVNSSSQVVAVDANNNIYIGTSHNALYKVKTSYEDVKPAITSELAKKTSNSIVLKNLTLPKTSQSYLQMTIDDSLSNSILTGQTISLVKAESTESN